MSLTKPQKGQVRALVLSLYKDRGGKSVKIAADGAVSVHVDEMPNTNQSGRIFAGWDTDLLREV